MVMTAEEFKELCNEKLNRQLALEPSSKVEHSTLVDDMVPIWATKFRVEVSFWKAVLVWLYSVTWSCLELYGSVILLSTNVVLVLMRVVVVTLYIVTMLFSTVMFRFPMMPRMKLALLAIEVSWKSEGKTTTNWSVWYSGDKFINVITMFESD